MAWGPVSTLRLTKGRGKAKTLQSRVPPMLAVCLSEQNTSNFSVHLNPTAELMKWGSPEESIGVLYLVFLRMKTLKSTLWTELGDHYGRVTGSTEGTEGNCNAIVRITVSNYQTSQNSRELSH